jgi:ketosteroid isomerase-like protein
MRADVPTEAEVMALLEKFSNACALRDTEDALRLFAQDDDILFVGSEAGKRSRGPKEIRAFFERLFSREDILLELGVAFGVGSRTGGVGDQGWR